MLHFINIVVSNVRSHPDFGDVYVTPSKIFLYDIEVAYSMIFDRLANGIQKHAKAIIVLWIVILLCTGVFALKSGEVMNYDTTSMAPTDSESVQGLVVIEQYFPSAQVDELSAPILVLYYDDATQLEAAKEFVKALQKAVEGHEYLGEILAMNPTSDTGPGILMAMMGLKNVGMEDMAVFVKHIPEIRQIITDTAEATGFTGSHYLTGAIAISYDTETSAMEDISKIDPFTILLILLLIGLFFRSFVTSATPPMVIGIAFVVSMGLIYFIGQVLDIFFITNMIILVSMMGAGCDYCIFIIARYREELRRGLSHDEAVHQSIVWAGESIAISGASVIIGFGAMVVCDYSLISTMGLCLALGVLIALLAALTFIPSLLQLVGDKIFWPTTIKEYSEGGKATKGWYAWCAKVGDRYFHSSAKFSIKHAKAIAITAILVTVPAVYVMSESEQSYDMITAMQGGESGEAMKLIGEYADQGMVMPNYSVIEYKDPIAEVTQLDGGLSTLHWTDNWYDNVQGSLDQLYADILEDDNIAYVSGPFVWSDIREALDESGITDTSAQLAFIKSIISSTENMYFDALIEATSKQGLKPEYIIDGPGRMIADILEYYNITYDWDSEVAVSVTKGITDADQIVADMEARFAEEHPGDQSSVLAMVVAGMNEKGIDNTMLVYGMGPIITAQLSASGVTFDWDAAVETVKASGVTDPDEVIQAIVQSVPAEQQPAFVAMIEQYNQNGITNDILVNGFGPVINSTLANLVQMDWDAAVAQAKAAGLTEPDDIISAIRAGFIQQYPTMGGMFDQLLETFHSLGLTNELLVDGFGPVIDYVMNVNASVIGGEFTETGSGEATFIKVTSATTDPAMSPRSMQSIAATNVAVNAYMEENADMVEQKWETGTAVVMYDVSEKVKEQFTFIEILVVVLIIILLFVVMRSYLIPLRSVLTILMSISWTLALTQIVFVNILGGEIIWLIPILLLVICLGLGMDYDILLTTRIKENVMALGMSNDDAISHAVTHTGSVITICGLIMGGAFGTLMLSSMPMLQQFGFALCFAILVDALIVRTYIVPAVMHLLGDWNWKGPGSKKRAKASQEEE